MRQVLLISSWFMAGRQYPISAGSFLTRAALVLLALAGSGFGQVDVAKLPNPTGYVNDFAHVVDAASKAQIEELSTSVEQQLGVQFAFVTVDSVGDRPIRDVALDIGRKWGVGPSKDNGGVLLLLSIKDRKSDIETGRGIEPYITDGFAGSTLRAMRPDLRAGEYGQALLVAGQTMAGQIAQGKGVAFSDGRIPQSNRQPASRGIPFPLILLGIFALLWLFSRGGGRRGGGYRGGGGGGFLTGLLLGNLFGGGRGGGGGWGGGGGFGGGASGGGGFGGFGGGDFGGGGASSDW